MNVEVRNINGVRGFCIYKGGVPYTYIYTRDAIGMLGFVEIKNNRKYLMIRKFGNAFIEVLGSERIHSIIQDIGITLTPEYAISQDQTPFANYCEPSTHESKAISDYDPKLISDHDGKLISHYDGKLDRRPSEYDHILPEFILDRVIFMIVNRMRSPKAQAFREALFMDIIPHFQQTATQEQISKVPILNTTSKFMYDNSNIKFVTQQAYNFNHQVIFSHVNKFAILTEETNLDAVFEKLFNGFQDALQESGINIYDEIMRVVEVRKSLNPYRTPEITKQDIIDTLICNVRLHNLFINFVSICIREIEKQILLKQNGQAIKQRWNEETGYDEDEIEYDDGLDHPVKFVSLDERAGQNPLQEETIRDYIPNAKRDTSWIY